MILERIGLRFRKAVAEFAAEGDIPVIRFAKGERKLEVMHPYLGRLARAGSLGDGEHGPSCLGDPPPTPRGSTLQTGRSITIGRAE
ncbi:MAG TPA: hypothetical protein VNA67_05945 [Pseudonocardiaceae bacterium]|nr:hypothetical protein [Pseudonocardiaceae bacterium]